MKTIYYLLQKEFLQIYRDKALMFILFAVPVVQLMILPYAATFELKNTEFHVVDYDQSPLSRRLINTFRATDYFSLAGQSFDIDQGITDILARKAQMVLVIPQNFEEEVRTGRIPAVQFVISAVDGSSAGLIQSYSLSVMNRFNSKIRPEIQLVGADGSTTTVAGFETVTANWYNTELDYIVYMVPGIMIVLVTLVCLLLSILNIVREREIGTIEQLNVTPIKKYQFITGKLVPTWIIAMLALTFALSIAYFWFRIPFQGDVLLIYATASIYLLAIQGLGLSISSISDTQQQAMFINFFVVMIFMLMGGIFTPIESMPEWAQQITLLNPMAHFAKIMRMVMLKGSEWADIRWMVGIITLMAAIVLPMASINYKKRVS